MSFRLVTLWAIQCDGDTPTGLCTERLHWYDDLGIQHRVLLESPELTPAQARALTEAGWMHLRDDSHRCPGHVTAAEHLAWESLEGRPFGDPQ